MSWFRKHRNRSYDELCAAMALVPPGGILLCNEEEMRLFTARRSRPMPERQERDYPLTDEPYP